MHTTGAQVICGPGENAGIVDGGDNDAIIFKMESHNHPSFIEPFNGAATGVGGILRDVFTMGARPIAVLDSLRFGDFKLPKTHELLKGVVHGISFYGNCVGVPNLGGECTFDEGYNTNNLTNAMAVGVAKKDKIFYSAATKVGAKVLYFGSKTGKDGIHGASMSSDSFDSNAKANKPTVQIGDPFTEKLLIECSLELMESGCVVAIQDMGAAGLTCSSAEMAGKGGNGIEIDINLVPLREQNMSAYEIMLSESQERMLMILNEEKEEKAFEILNKWGLSHAVIGTITDTKKMIVKENGVVVCDLPIDALSEEAPIYEKPYEVKVQSANPLTITKKEDEVISILKEIISSPDMIDKSFIIERYDTGVGNGVVIKPGEAGAGVVMFGSEYEAKIPASIENKNLFKSQLLLKMADAETENQKEIKYITRKGVAVSTKCTPRYVYADAKNGAQLAVLGTYRNIAATGALPLALTNCLNFASPESPEVMGQIVASIEGISNAAKNLDFPIVSGNASLSNQTNDRCIKPTPAIGGVGIIKDALKACNYKLKNEEEFIFVIGATKGHLQNTLYANVIEKHFGGLVPEVNFKEELLNSNFVKDAVVGGFVSASAAVLDAGIIGKLCKMSLSSNQNIGFALNLKEKTEGLSLIEYLFAEDSGRFILTVPKEFSTKFIEMAIERGILYNHIGFTIKDEIEINSYLKISVEELREVNKVKV